MVRMKVFPERDGNPHDRVDTAAGVGDVRMKVFPERDGNQLLRFYATWPPEPVRMKVFPERDGNLSITSIAGTSALVSPNEGLP